jgi:hypothetical protein
VSEPSAFEVEMAFENLVRTKSPGTDQIPAELMTAEGRKFHAEIHKLINSIWNKEELPEDWRSRSSYPSSRRAIKQIVVIIGAYHFCQIRSKLYPASCCQC